MRILVIDHTSRAVYTNLDADALRAELQACVNYGALQYKRYPLGEGTCVQTPETMAFVTRRLDMMIVDIVGDIITPLDLPAIVDQIEAEQQ